MDESVAAARLVAHLPTERGELVAQPVRSLEVARRAGRGPTLGELGDLRRSLVALGERPEPEEASPRRSSSSCPVDAHSWSTASAAGVSKSSSSASANASQPDSSCAAGSSVNAFRSVSRRAAACAIVSGEKSIGLRQDAVRKKTSTASRPHSSIVSRIVATLPADLDIFSPVKRSIPLCAQICANGCPSARDCATSFSWWGKTRSSPPPWISNAGP